MIKKKLKWFIMIMLIALSFITTAKALSPGGSVGASGGKAAGATGNGVSLSCNSGIRIYVIDKNGNRCSSVADILQPMSPQGTLPAGWTVIGNPRFTDGFTFWNFPGYGESLTWTPLMRSESLSNGSTYSAFSKTEIRPVSRSFNYDGVNVHISSNHGTMAPAANSQDSKRGTDIKKYFQGDSSAPQLNQLPLEDSEEVLDPVYANSQFQTLFCAESNDGDTVIKLNLKPVLNPVDGLPDYIQTLAANNCTVCIEPLYYGVYDRYDGNRTANIILGTPYNTYQFIADGQWTPDDAYNGNSSICTNNVIPWSMYLDKDLKINGATKLKQAVPEYNLDVAITQNSLQWAVGYGFMYFKFSGSKGTEIPTYDDEPPDGMKPNPKPHPAPNADPNYPTPEKPRIPLVPGEDPTKTRTVNIVKTYVIEYLNGTEEHVATYTRTKVPQTIRMLQEPEYKLVGYITSPDYYFEKAGISGAGVKETTWDTMMGAIDQQQSYRVMKYEDSKSRYNTGELVGEDIGWENPVKISEACKCESKAPYDGGHPKHWNKVI